MGGGWVGPEGGRELGELGIRPRGKDADGVLGAGRSDDQLRLVADQDASDPGQPGNREQMFSRCRIEDVHRVVRSVGNIDVAAGRMGGGVVKAALSRMRGESDVSNVPERVVAHKGVRGRWQDISRVHCTPPPRSFRAFSLAISCRVAGSRSHAANVARIRAGTEVSLTTGQSEPNNTWSAPRRSIAVRTTTG